MYAIGFEEMVDLDAKNIMNASSENAKGWASELTKMLNRDEKFVLVTYLQLVGVCLYVFVKPELAPYIKDVAAENVKTGMYRSHQNYEFKVLSNIKVLYKRVVHSMGLEASFYL